MNGLRMDLAACRPVAMGLALAVGFSPVGSASEPETQPESRSGDSSESEPFAAPLWWGPIGGERAVLGVEGIREDDPSGVRLEGVRFVTGSWDEAQCDFNGRGFWHVARLSGEKQRVYRVGADAGLILLGVGPVRLLPHFGLALDYRKEPPDDGFGGVFTVGLETTVWVGHFVQVAFLADRQFGFPSGTRNQLGVAVRWTPRELPWWRPIRGLP